MIENFNVEKFLEANPDIKMIMEEKVFNSFEEYMKQEGLKEIREGIRQFHIDYEPYDEKRYLFLFPDIKEAVEKGVFKSGFEHFCKFGYKEILNFIRIYDKNRYIGYIENYFNGEISGWVVDLKNLNSNLKFDLFVNNKCVATNVTPNIFREDLLNKFKFNGKFGFKVAVGYIENGNVYIKVNNRFVKTNNFIIDNRNLMSFKNKEEEILEFYPYLKELFYNNHFIKLMNEIENIIKNDFNNPLLLLYIKVILLYKLDLSIFPFLNKVSDNRIKFLINHLIFNTIKYLWKEKGDIYVNEFEIKHIILFIKLILNENLNDLIIEDNFKISLDIEFYHLVDRFFRSKYYLKPNHMYMVLDLLLDNRLKYKLNQLKNEYEVLYKWIKKIWLDVLKVNDSNLYEYLLNLSLFNSSYLNNILLKNVLDLIKILLQFRKRLNISYIIKVLEEKEKNVECYEIKRKIRFLKPVLYYLLGDLKLAYKFLEELLAEYDIFTIEWNVNFLSEILYDFGYLYGFKNIDSRFYELIKNKIKENRSCYKDNLFFIRNFDLKDFNLYSLALKNFIWRLFEFDGQKSELNILLKDNDYYWMLYPYLDFYIRLKNILENKKFNEESNKFLDINNIDEVTELFKIYLYNEKICNCKIKDNYLGLISDLDNNFLFKNKENKTFIVFQKVRNKKEFDFYNNFYSLLKRRYDFLKNLKIIYILGNNLYDENFSKVFPNKIRDKVKGVLYLDYDVVFNHKVIMFFDDLNVNECIIKNKEVKIGIFKKYYSADDVTLFLNELEKFDLKYEVKTGILSFSNINEEDLVNLMNFNLPVFLLYESISKSLDYLTQIYKISDNIKSVNTENVSLTILKTSKIKNEDIACFIVERNEKEKLESFLDYYRELGVDKFYVIDNASDDNTLTYLSKFKDIELISTPQAYSQSLYGVKWCDIFIKSKRINKWNLIIDADELLILNDFKNLKELKNYLDENSYDSLYVPFIDMYSKNAIKDTPLKKGLENLKECGYYDKVFFTYYTLQGGIVGNLPTFQGGVRFRHFNLNTVVLNKIPFFKYNPKMKLREGLHWIDNCNPLFGEGVLLHFKYTHFFYDYVEREIKRGQHWNNASEYKQYYEVIKNHPEFSLFDKDFSVSFKDVKTFFESLVDGF